MNILQIIALVGAMWLMFLLVLDNKTRFMRRHDGSMMQVTGDNTLQPLMWMSLAIILIALFLISKFGNIY